jgi:choline dehydrogenase-like flavoprotein
MEGVIALATRNFICGAEEIHVGFPGVQPFVRNPDPSFPLSFESQSPSPAQGDEDVNVRFSAWLSKVKSAGNAPPAATFASAHQMGTNRMSSKPSLGVVDVKGRVWGTEGLYVADASVLPSASGVNPMVTTMAICDWISREMVHDLKRKQRLAATKL